MTGLRDCIISYVADTVDCVLQKNGYNNTGYELTVRTSHFAKQSFYFRKNAKQITQKKRKSIKTHELMRSILSIFHKKCVTKTCVTIFFTTKYLFP